MVTLPWLCRSDAVRLILFLALATSWPSASCTYSPATRPMFSALNSLKPCLFSVLIVVVMLLTSRPASRARVWLAVIVPPILLISVCAVAKTSRPCIKPPTLFMLLASRFTNWRPAMLPWLLKSPLSFKLTVSPAIKAPLLFKSPGCTATYTFGTKTWIFSPSTVMVSVTSHTISLVNRAICASESFTPTLKLRSLAALTPESIKALNWSSKFV